MKKEKWNILIQLSRNDIKSKYANSIIGIVWAFVMTLVTILMFWYVFQQGFRDPPRMMFFPFNPPRTRSLPPLKAVR